MSKSQTGGKYSHLLDALNPRQRKLFEDKISLFQDYLRTEAKDPIKGTGYPEGSIPSRLSRVLTIVEWTWDNEGPSTSITPEQADRALEALKKDNLTRDDGDPYYGGSKRKISDALENWFAFESEDWEPKVSFNGSGPQDNAAPFTSEEAQLLWETSLDYKSIPAYNNLSPDERRRWKRYISQSLGKPMDDVVPADWDRVNQDWKVPSIVGCSKCAGFRPALIGRMRVDWYYPEERKIVIPGEFAVKNNEEWEQTINQDAAIALDNWIEQRANMEKYDGRSEMWLTRKANPYSSNSLNYLLNDLIEEAGITPRGRKLVWYSFRHYVGTYLYDEYQDLKLVADKLRQKSTRSAARYVHPTDELKQEAAELL
ncbi:site-specific integrase [Haloarchaeobius sp. FL176]|uniref:tyrosine-type recombinase/integrase n=1 Tax=Haloarchaeobius sp. FL176 TaxID=2967129 RepID=UPI0021491C1B